MTSSINTADQVNQITDMFDYLFRDNIRFNETLRGQHFEHIYNSQVVGKSISKSKFQILHMSEYFSSLWLGIFKLVFNKRLSSDEMKLLMCVLDVPNR